MDGSLHWWLNGWLLHSWILDGWFHTVVGCIPLVDADFISPALVLPLHTTFITVYYIPARTHALFGDYPAPATHTYYRQYVNAWHHYCRHDAVPRYVPAWNDSFNIPRTLPAPIPHLCVGTPEQRLFRHYRAPAVLPPAHTRIFCLLHVLPLPLKLTFHPRYRTWTAETILRSILPAYHTHAPAAVPGPPGPYWLPHLYPVKRGHSPNTCTAACYHLG